MNDSLREATARLRHDLRTPINHILGYSELVGEDLEDRGVPAPPDLEKIRSAALRLLEIVEASGSAPATKEAERTPRPPATIHHAGPPEAAPREARRLPRGRVLVVDDDPGNRETLARRLIREGLDVCEAGDGREALEKLARGDCDLVLLDVMMPVMDGFATLGAIRKDPATRDLPVIMVSALDEIDAVTRCIENGAEDYLPKPCEPALLRARIGACLEKKQLRDQERRYLKTIEETQERLSGELREAARCVESMLPPEIDSPLKIRWRFAPSTELGGDALGYHQVDERRFAIYLLDVCGHGVGAALLSVAASGALRARSLPGVDFSSPAAVLAGLNDAFPMESNGDMYFSIWYGVYDLADRTLLHASGGHPPAILLDPRGAAREISCPNLLVGVMRGTRFAEDRLEISPGSRLVLFSDGAYEIHAKDGAVLGLDDFVDWASAHANDPGFVQATTDRARAIAGREVLEDDLSVLCVDFPQ